MPSRPPTSLAPRWRLGLALAAAVVCALAFALVYLAPVPQSPSDPDSLARAEPPPDSEWNEGFIDLGHRRYRLLFRPFGMLLHQLFRKGRPEEPESLSIPLGDNLKALASDSDKLAIAGGSTGEPVVCILSCRECLGD